MYQEKPSLEVTKNHPKQPKISKNNFVLDWDINLIFFVAFQIVTQKTGTYQKAPNQPEIGKKAEKRRKRP